MGIPGKSAKLLHNLLPLFKSSNIPIPFSGARLKVDTGFSKREKSKEVFFFRFKFDRDNPSFTEGCVGRIDTINIIGLGDRVFDNDNHPCLRGGDVRNRAKNVSTVEIGFEYVNLV